MSASGTLSKPDKIKNSLILTTAALLAALAFWRAYSFDNNNTALVFAEVAAAYVIIQAAVESTTFPNERFKDCSTYALKVISAVIAVLVVYAA